MTCFYFLKTLGEYLEICDPFNHGDIIYIVDHGDYMEITDVKPKERENTNEYKWKNPDGYDL
jgi:hypothetical protein